MKKHVISIILSVVMLMSLVPMSLVFATTSTTIIVSADKTSAYPNDVVKFEISIGAVKHLMGAEFKVAIPVGMTYVSKSASVADGLKTTLGCAAVDWTDSSMKFTMYGDGDYSSNSNTTILTFSCRIESNAVDSVVPQITDIVLSDTGFGEIITQINYDEGTVAISQRPIPITGILLNKKTISLNKGSSETLIATVFPDNATNKTVKWESSDNSVATVDNSGKVTALKKGTTTITVITEYGEFSDTCAVSVACSHTNTTIHPAVVSTCKVHGNNEYTTCDDCGEVVKGSNVKLPLVKHSGGKASCTQKAICTVCGNEYGDLPKHIYTETVDGKYLVSAATCGSKAVYNKSCSVCGVKSDETFETGEYDYINHIGSTYTKNQKEATCCAEGYTGDIYCSTCNHEIEKGMPIAKNAHNPASVWTTDETDHWKECQTVGCGNVIDKAAHSGGEATCVNKAVCEVCKAQYGDVDATNHKHTEIRDAKPAAEQEKGYTGDTWCTDCDKKIATGSEIAMLEHKPKLVEAKDATVTEQGNIKYYYCDNCGKYFADEDGTKEISLSETVIKKLPPEIIEGNNTTVNNGEKKSLTFRSNAAFTDFIRVELDGKTLDENNYTKSEGSISITLKGDFVSILSAGGHTLGIVSESGTATAKFTVKAAQIPTESPKTGDNNMVAFWSLAAILSLAVLGATTIVSKKKRAR